MRKTFAAVAVTALAGPLAATALASTRTVKVGDDYFVHAGRDSHTIDVSKGTRLRFRWVGGDVHNVHAYKGPRHFSSSTKTSGTYTYRFRRRGTYRLVCDIHPQQMRLTVHVR